MTCKAPLVATLDSNSPATKMAIQLSSYPITITPSKKFSTETRRLESQTLPSQIQTPNSNCIPSINNISLQGRFDLVPNQTNLFLFHNCNSSVHESWPSEFYPSCYGENDTVLALSKQDPKLSNVSMECKSSVLAPVEAYGGGIVESLRNGFELRWKASNCSICEDSGGYCGFDHIKYHFKCFCPNRPRAWKCTNPPDQFFSLEISLSFW